MIFLFRRKMYNEIESNFLNVFHSENLDKAISYSKYRSKLSEIAVYLSIF